MPAVQIALIHNNDAGHNAYLVPQLETLAAEIGSTLTNFAWQPPIRPHSTATLVYRNWQYAALAWKWSQYRRLGVTTGISVFVGEIRTRTINLFRPGRRLPDARTSFIETLVTSKHILAWQHFLESDATHLICCEDDLVFKPDSIDRLQHWLAEATPDDRLTYVDLAGGLPMTVLNVDRLVAAKDVDRIRFSPAVTNTACCYMLSRALAAHFADQLLRRPNFRLVGIDWMINTMLMALYRNDVACDGLHFCPPIFDHGTFTGSYRSWTQTGPQQDEPTP